MLTLCFLLMAIAGTSQQVNLDLAFSLDGIYTDSLDGSNVEGINVHVNADNQVILAGYVKSGEERQIVLMKLLENGEPDLSFGENGMATSAVPFIGGSYGWMACSVLQPDGRVIVVSVRKEQSSERGILVHRFLADGNVDPGFGTGGTTFIPLPGYWPMGVVSIEVLEDEKILIGGEPDLIRLHSDGEIDSTFAKNGLCKYGESATKSFSVLPDGKIVTFGHTYDEPWSNVLTRFLPNGSLDSLFGTDGSVFSSIGTGCSGFDMVTMPDQRIVVCGDTTLMCFLPDGSLDDHFGTHGIKYLYFENYTLAIKSMSLDLEGKILLTGQISGSGTRNEDKALYPFLIRLNPDGSLDQSFGYGGLIKSPVQNSRGNDIRVDSNARIVIGGTASFYLVWPPAGVYVGREFLIMRYVDGLTSGVLHLASEDESMLVYPNPLSEKFTLEYSLHNCQQLSAALYAQNGKHIHSFFSNEQRCAGKHTETCMVPGGLPDGAYVLTLSSAKVKRSILVLKGDAF